MSAPGPLLLIVEDEPQLRRFLRTALGAQDYRLVEAESVKEAMVAATTHNPELILLDIGLPDGSGIDLTRRIREWSQVPILVISARGRESDKVLALDAGADDYLTKPFGVGELLARVRALLRRHALEEDATPLRRFGEVEIDLSRRQVRRAGEDLHLTQIEYRLLAVLLANEGKVMTHRHLMREVWGPGHAEQGHYLRIYVGRLRQKLEDDPARPRHFLTETGVGYRFQS